MNLNNNANLQRKEKSKEDIAHMMKTIFEDVDMSLPNMKMYEEEIFDYLNKNCVVDSVKWSNEKIDSDSLDIFDKNIHKYIEKRTGVNIAKDSYYMLHDALNIMLENENDKVKKRINSEFYEFFYSTIKQMANRSILNIDAKSYIISKIFGQKILTNDIFDEGLQESEYIDVCDKALKFFADISNICIKNFKNNKNEKIYISDIINDMFNIYYHFANSIDSFPMCKRNYPIIISIIETISNYLDKKIINLDKNYRMTMIRFINIMIENTIALEEVFDDIMSIVDNQKMKLSYGTQDKKFIFILAGSAGSGRNYVANLITKYCFYLDMTSEKKLNYCEKLSISKLQKNKTYISEIYDKIDSIELNKLPECVYIFKCSNKENAKLIEKKANEANIQNKLIIFNEYTPSELLRIFQEIVFFKGYFYNGNINDKIYDEIISPEIKSGRHINSHDIQKIAHIAEENYLQRNVEDKKYNIKEITLSDIEGIKI